MECTFDFAFFFLFMMTCLADALQMNPQNISQPTKIVKSKNIDITLKCSLMETHETYNQNANVTWWFKRTCKVPCWNQVEDEWTEVDCKGRCRTTLTLDDENSFNGFYMCKIFPYQINPKTVLYVQITKTYLLDKVDPMQAPPPEILDEPSSHLTIPANSQVVLQCKCRSSQKTTTIKWFKKKDLTDEHSQDSYKNFIQNTRSIKYFENFYEPIVSSGLKALTDNLYLNKLILNNITQNSVYVCVAINYYGFSFRETLIEVEVELEEIQEEISGDEIISYPEKQKQNEIVVLILVLLLMPISVLTSTILYLLITRQMLRWNKNVDFV